MRSLISPAVPKHHTSEEADATGAAVPDPTAHTDLNTGAVISVKSKAERKFVARLDVFLLLYGCCSQILKYLDQQNISAAYVSGMKEDLNLHGNEYNYFTTFFNIGYAIFLIPSQIIITRIRPSIWLPTLEFAWGVLTLALYKVHDAKQVYVLRTFIGCLEASAYPGALMLFMSWYTPREIAFRIGFYHSCQQLGGMMAGALTSAIYTTLDGRNGLAGWRWMFIVDGIVTMIYALAGFWLIPDFPTMPNPRSFWLRPQDIDMAVQRTSQFRRTANKKFTWQTVKRTARSPLLYFFATLYPACVLAQAGYQYFNLFLKTVVDAEGKRVWSVAALNAIPIGGGAIAVVVVWFWAFVSDYFQTRWLVVMAQAAIGLIPSIIMSVWNVPLGAKYFSYFACFLSLATAPPIFAWMSDLSPHDAEQRAFIIGFSIAFYYAVGAWSNVLIWPASQVPHYRVAWQCSIALWCLVIIELCALRYTELKWIRPRNMKIAADKWEVEPPVDSRKIGDDEGMVQGEHDEKDFGAVDRVRSI